MAPRPKILRTISKFLGTTKMTNKVCRPINNKYINAKCCEEQCRKNNSSNKDFLAEEK
uniref:Uncharacterized protein n=1 Tax=Romanomermis culicivorax TaxID=13658 RepID=A0A915JZP9_ROMCU